jgi:cell division protein FtsB
MRLLSLVLLALLAVVNTELWFGRSGVPRSRELSAQVTEQQAANAQASERNAKDRAELKDLREGLEIVEEKARGDLGMIKADEVLVQYTR